MPDRHRCALNVSMTAIWWVISQDECGEWVTALCPYAETGCPDNDGDFDIVMPEPMSGTSGSGYKVRVADVDDEESADCSDEFFLLASEEVCMDQDTVVFFHEHLVR